MLPEEETTWPQLPGKAFDLTEPQARNLIGDLAERQEAIHEKTGADEGGTFDLHTHQKIEYRKGYQVSFELSEAQWKSPEWQARMREMNAISDDHKAEAGVYEDWDTGHYTGEISVHVRSRAVALRYAQDHNQQSIYDWAKKDYISSKGTGSWTRSA